TEGSTLFEIYQAIATPDETAALARRYAEGAGWGDLKKELFEYLDAHLAEARSNYERLIADPGHVEAVLKAGAERARSLSVPFMKELRHAVGLRPVG
ncbi:MAG: tryptophan--tRNA ligase, partial [Gammaproteobacteria bacterium]|nr:tryptophan--tRNA ligase [Gammaproteobacteria bacterium]